MLGSLLSGELMRKFQGMITPGKDVMKEAEIKK